MWRAWLPSLVWLAIITLESTTLGSSENTLPILYRLVHFLTGVDPIHFLVWHHYLRKSGHFIGYSMLSWLLFRSWRASLPLRDAIIWAPQWARIAWFSATLVACLDEWHQTYLASRTGNVGDVILDSFAALTAQFLLWAAFRWRTRSDREPNFGPA